LRQSAASLRRRRQGRRALLLLLRVHLITDSTSVGPTSVHLLLAPAAKDPTLES